MNKDRRNDLQTILQAVVKFTADRGWQQYHTPKNIAMNLVREATEVMEHLVWPTNEEILKDKKRLEEIKDEIGDVLHALLLLADSLDVDLASCFWKKLEKTGKRYPPNKE